MAPAPPAWLDELPRRVGPPWVSMGVRPLAAADWLVVDGATRSELRRKADLLARRRDEVFLADAGSEPAGREVLALVQAWLGAHDPTGAADASGDPAPRPNDRGPAEPAEPAGATGPAADVEIHPLDAAGRLVAEDLCLLEDRGSGAVLVAASVCFPSHWRIAEKMGRTVAEIHGPVHHYAEELSSKVDTFLRRLTADRPVVRRNLSVHDHDDLFAPEPPETYEGFTGGIDELWLRSERQTLVRLPRTGAILFTIKTQQCPVAVLRDRPALCADLALRYAALGNELARIGEPASVPTGWVPWLQARAAGR